ncbi:hypothetical protein RIF29_20469 [Crotalaria pallida]|uniref:Uncharacterized protein n=1 Tax=Crotalaria pallida TaxID=3830 RepID=A0AAN9I8Q2_CROPI
MARKRGRPPKTPSSSNKKTQEQQPHKEDENFRVDLSLSDEETLEEIDNLSPKKAEVLLRNLETLRARIEGKIQEKEKTDSRGSDKLNEIASKLWFGCYQGKERVKKWTPILLRNKTRLTNLEV